MLAIEWPQSNQDGQLPGCRHDSNPATFNLESTVSDSHKPKTQINPEQWHILGTGAIGGLWALRLDQAGIKTTIITRASGYNLNVERSDDESVDSSGYRLRVTLGEADSTSRHTASLPSIPADRLTTGKIKKLLIATKAGDCASALAGVKHALANDATVLCLSNGLGYQGNLLRILTDTPGAKLWWGVTSDGATSNRISEKGTEQLQVIHTGRGSTIIGPVEGESRHYALANQPNEIAQIFWGPDSSLQQTLKLDTQFSSQISMAMWKKFYINCAINPLTAVHRCPNGQLIEAPSLHEKFCALCEELHQLSLKIDSGSLSGDLRKNDPLDIWPKGGLLSAATEIARNTAMNHSSMLQDVRRKRQTELQYLNQFAIQLAEKAGMDCPENRELVRALINRGC